MAHIVSEEINLVAQNVSAVFYSICCTTVRTLWQCASRLCALSDCRILCNCSQTWSCKPKTAVIRVQRWRVGACSKAELEQSGVGDVSIKPAVSRRWTLDSGHWTDKASDMKMTAIYRSRAAYPRWVWRYSMSALVGDCCSLNY